MIYTGLVILVVILLVINLVFYKKIKQKKGIVQEPRNLEHIEIPLGLGIRDHLPFDRSLWAIQNAMNDDLKEKIKQLFYRDPKNQHVSEHEFHLRYFELQRYFIMCSLLKDVPMFSDEVDEVWHTFILSTKDYDKFGDRFMGEFLHHNPAVTRTPNPHGRAWFDLLYTQLFEFTGFSGMTWGAFYRHPLSESQINELKDWSVERIKAKYFRAGSDAVEVEALITQLKQQVSLAFKKGLSKKSRPFTPEQQIPFLQQAPFFAQAMIFYSAYQAADYDIRMQDVQRGFRQTTTNSSACGTGTTNIDTSSCGSDCGNGGGD